MPWLSWGDSIAHLVDVRAFAVHDVGFPVSGIHVTVRVSHLADAGFFAVGIVSLVDGMDLTDVNDNKRTRSSLLP